jgi:hypothetical protein
MCILGLSEISCVFFQVANRYFSIFHKKMTDANDKTEKKKSEHSFTADQLNWEQRVKTELESGKKWNENWGPLFDGGVPNDYTERVRFLENELKK